MRLSVVVAISKETVNEFRRNDLMGMAHQAAYSLIFALPPLLIFFTALSSLAVRYTGVDVFAQVLDVARRGLPPPIYQTVDIVLKSAQSKAGTDVLSIGLVLALWGASGAVGAMMKAFNRAYDADDHRSYVKRKAIQIGLTLGLSVLVLASFILFVFGQRLGAWVAGRLGLGATFAAAWNIGRWPVIVIFSMVALAILYWAAPAIPKTFRWITPGAVLATLLWLGATFGFSLYLQIADPGSAYGALGALVVFLFFLYISSVILLLGAQLDAVVELRYDPEVRLAVAANRATREKPGETAAAKATPRDRTGGASPERVSRRTATTAVLLSFASLVAAAIISAFRRGERHAKTGS